MSPGGRRRLGARTLSRARWAEYRAILRLARDHGYAVVPLGAFLEAAAPAPRTLVLRHDVDQDPRAALRMAREERLVGVTSTWFVRWRTAHPELVRTLIDAGHEVGLHYETLTRAARALHRSAGSDLSDLIEPCRATLVRELELFATWNDRRCACAAHGDTRLAGVSNGVLLRRQDPERFGVPHDANHARALRGLDLWLTDRSAANGGWAPGAAPRAALEQGRGPILLVTHPNNWAAGLSLWRDTALRVMPAPTTAPHARTRIVRSGSDVPPFSGAS